MIDLATARVAKFEAETKRALAEAKNFELQNTKLSREEAVEMALTDEAHVFPFYAPVDESTVGKTIGILDMWSRKDPGCDITIIFNSPGGHVTDGLALFDFIGTLRTDGHKVTTKCYGMAASMGAVLMQSGEDRIMTPHSFMHIHEISQSYKEGTRLTMGALDDEQKMARKMNETLLEILSERSTLTRKQISSRWTRKEWLLTAKEAVEAGFADRIE